ncbi:Peptidyl-prolyl cis-trans isomerase (PPIase), binds to the drugs FK506 and rapamycin [Komagataella phaffii GS115]|uniref:peptidylprolyl isomerase n=2 Tax=Komagataella phaffii TaxID=460519 RepID=C4R206_KOMPG|nr:Peptidyl-prolyl cis-trans isomerase (PPIase), binds to the drugs FK506 and rapamycin [Komagataella phaffii GS115]AOA62197.1 GQ67_00951T0 [Komagataella phaffii]AOA67139.1 GQ68_00438T0 [Komagataella phaffii GS115]CAY69530.1 Peptidyl-prolyl cis-trans isomerase (PPIase), binds to the drugs FK506 and rapamycin [Komagataella phaffii GS115]
MLTSSLFRRTLTQTCRRTFISSAFSMSQNQEVKIERISPGDGKSFPSTGDLVTIHYVGTLENGKKFDSSRDRNQPFQTYIGVGQVIQGWDQAIPKLSIGEIARLTIPGPLAYGSRGFPNIIPPNATLIFEVELLGIN